MLADFLIENDANDPDAGDPADWPGWTDADVWEEGPAFPPDAVLIPPDPDEIADYLERLRYEEGCNARFVD